MPFFIDCISADPSNLIQPVERRNALHCTALPPSLKTQKSETTAPTNVLFETRGKNRFTMSFSFGGAAATPAPAATGGFGLAAAPAVTGAAAPLSFGATQPAGSGGSAFNFAAPKPTGTVAPLTLGGGFGTSAAPATTTAAVAPLSFGGGFGGAATSTAAVQPTLGATTTSAAPAFGGFGTAATTAAAPATQAGAFGTATSTAAAAPTFGGFGVAASTAPTTAASTLSFGAPAAASTAAGATPAFGLGGTTATAAAAPGAPAATTGFGLGGTAASTAAVTTATTTPKVGLGGIANPLATAGQGQGQGGENKGDPKNLKETQIPNELAITVEEFKKFVKEERSTSSDIAHISSKVHQKIKADTDGLLNLVKALSSGLAKNKAQLDRLKLDAAQELLNVEIAQRTKDTPPALQYENVAPYEYFSYLVVNFENQMLVYRRQIEETEQHLQTMATQQTLSPDDITKAIQKLHASFTNLAGRFQKIHEMVQQQKEMYSQIHRCVILNGCLYHGIFIFTPLFPRIFRQRYGKSTDLFDKKSISGGSSSSGLSFSSSRIPTTVGPSPFTGQQDLLAMAKASLSARGPQQQAGQPGQPQGQAPPTLGLGMAPGFQSQPQPGLVVQSQPGLLGNTINPFQTSFGQQNNSTMFQTSGKRGKH